MSLWSITLSGMIYLLRKIFFWVFLLENRKMREVILETERLVLRTLEQDDFDEVYSIIRDSNVASQNVARRNGMTKVDSFTHESSVK